MTIITGVIVVGLAATAIALIAGIASMGRGGEYDLAHSNQLMFTRVGLQAITLVCLIVALWLLN